MKAVEEYFPVALVFIMLYQVMLTFEFADGFLDCDHSNKSY